MLTERTAEAEEALHQFHFAECFAILPASVPHMGKREHDSATLVARQRAKLPTFHQHVSIDFVKPYFVLIIKSKA